MMAVLTINLQSSWNFNIQLLQATMGQLQHPVAFISSKCRLGASSDFLHLPVRAAPKSSPVIPSGLRCDIRSGFCTLLCDKSGTFPTLSLMF